MNNCNPVLLFLRAQSHVPRYLFLQTNTQITKDIQISVYAALTVVKLEKESSVFIQRLK